MLDFLQTVRFLRRHLRFTVTAVAVVTAGIVGVTTLGTVVGAALFRVLPYRQPGSIVELTQFVRSGGANGVVFRLDYESIVQQAPGVEGACVIGASTPLSLGMPMGVVEVPAVSMTSNALDVLGVRPALGRGFTPADEHDPDGYILLTWHGWVSEFARDASVIGRTVLVQGRGALVIGVLPRDFIFPISTPEAPEIAMLRSFRGAPAPGEVVSTPFVRLKPAVSLSEMQAEANRIVWALPDRDPRQPSVSVRPLSYSALSLPVASLWWLVGGVCLVLASANLNFSALLLSSYERRRDAVVTQLMLGRSFRGIVRLLAFESVVLCAIVIPFGMLLSAALALWLFASLPSTYGGAVPAPFLRALWTLGPILPVATAVLCGVPSAIGFSAKLRDPGIWRAGPRSVVLGRSLTALLGGQLCAALVLAASAAMVFGELRAVRASDLGYRPVGGFVIGLFGDGHDASIRSIRRREELLDEVRDIPGVSAAGFSDVLSMSGVPSPVADLEFKAGTASRWEVSSGYLPATGAQFVAGRDFLPAEEEADDPVIVLSERAARLAGTSLDGWVDDRQGRVRRIIGIVRDQRSGYASAPVAMGFVPAATAREGTFVLVVRSRLEGAAVAERVAERIQAKEPRWILSPPQSLTAALNRGLETIEFPASILGVAALLALIVVCGGTYGVTSQWTSAYARELGIRVALGASLPHLLILVVQRLGPALAAGAVFGLLTAFLVSRSLASVVVHAPQTSVGPLLAATAVVCGCVLPGVLFPLRRAIRLGVASLVRLS